MVLLTNQFYVDHQAVEASGHDRGYSKSTSTLCIWCTHSNNNIAFDGRDDCIESKVFFGDFTDEPISRRLRKIY